MAESKLQVVLEAKDDASSKVKGLEISFAKMAGAVAIGNLAYDAAKKAISVATGVVKDSLSAYADSEKAQAKVDAILLKLNDKTGKFSDVVKEASKKALQLGFDDETAAEGMAKLLLVTKDSSKANDALTTAMDLARFKGVDLETSTQMVTMAMAGNQKMLKQLYGIDLPEDVKGMEAVGLIHDKVAGQADAYGKTTAGAQDKLKNAIENAQEALGEKFAPVFNTIVESITKFVTSEKFTNTLDKIGKFINEKIVPAIKFWYEWFNDKVIPIIRDVIIPLLKEHFGAAIDAVKKLWEKHKDVIEKVMKIIGIGAAGTLVAALLAAAGAITAIATALDKAIDGFKWILDKASAIQGAMEGAFGGGIGGIVKDIGGLFGKQHGGLITGGKPYLVGEQGPELFMPQSSGRIVPNNQMGGAITVNFNNPTVRNDGDLNVIINEVKRALNGDLRRVQIGA